VLLKVLKVPADHPLLYQRSLRRSELRCEGCAGSGGTATRLIRPTLLRRYLCARAGPVSLACTGGR
jgi:hypothetical protein